MNNCNDFLKSYVGWPYPHEENYDGESIREQFGKELIKILTEKLPIKKVSSYFIDGFQQYKKEIMRDWPKELVDFFVFCSAVNAFVTMSLIFSNRLIFLSLLV